MSEPPCFTIAEAARALRDRALSPVELVDLCLARIERHESRLNAFITLTAQAARAEAQAAQAEFARHGPRSPLHGIPVGLKDIFATRGVRTTAHSAQLADWVPQEDSTVAAQLARAGAISLGKLATHEFAFGGPAFDLPWPPARNPWNPAHFPGGSSSGTAVAVAAGFILGGIGSDTGGSIRGPAALCGVTGLKPTYGLVSRHGVLPLAQSLDHAGPMAWTVEDCALLLDAIAGHDPRDPASARRPRASYAPAIGARIDGLRVGVVRHFFERDNPVSAASQDAIETALGVLRALGCTVRDVNLPPLQDWHAAGMLILLAEAYAVHEHGLRERPQRYGQLVRDRVALGAFITAADYVQAQRCRSELIGAFDALMREVDVLVTVSQQGEAPRMDAVPKWATVEVPSYNIAFNLTGAPAITLCCGFGADGLPLGMQMVARPFEEPTLLAAAHRYEQAAGWRARRPAL